MPFSFIWEQYYRIEVHDALKDCLKKCGIKPEDILSILDWAFGLNWMDSPTVLLPTRWNFLKDRLSRDTMPMFMTMYVEEAVTLIIEAYIRSADKSTPDYRLLDLQAKNSKLNAPKRPYLTLPKKERYERQKSFEQRMARYLERKAELSS